MACVLQSFSIKAKPHEEELSSLEFHIMNMGIQRFRAIVLNMMLCAALYSDRVNHACTTGFLSDVKMILYGTRIQRA